MKHISPLLLLVMAFAISGCYLSAGDSDGDSDSDSDSGNGRSGSSLWRSGPDVAPVDNASYSEECGSCHMAYQPGLLPAASWQAMMSDLENHFDENAELGMQINPTLTQYLIANSAEHADYRRSRQVMASLHDRPPLRISEIPFIRHEHDEIPQRMIAENPDVISIANCNACHTEADQGSYDEDRVEIPGYGHWDD